MPAIKEKAGMFCILGISEDFVRFPLQKCKASVRENNGGSIHRLVY